ncbi:MAG: sigma-54-dependent transcriptional regulator [Candidatus Methylomirabilia bacterium]
MAGILIVDDEPNIRWIFGKILTDAGFQVRSAESGAAARQMVRDLEPDLIFLDYQLPDTNGLDLMRALKAEGCASQFILITAFESVKTAVAAVKEGAFDYLSKPIDNEEILLSARRALEVSNLRQQVANYRETISHLRGAAQLIGRSPALQTVVRAAERAATSEINVLLTGESGTGKDLVAHLIHDLSARREGPFVVVDCGSLPETLAESEIFGHEKGAFTGAVARSLGKFALAQGGTLFLDEIGNAPASLQAKLLRAIETKTFDRLGGSRPVHADARVIAATNRDLRRMDAEGSFRADLFYRLGGFHIALPPLRERTEDIPELAAAFIGKIALQQHREGTPPGLTPEALQSLLRYRWPGNVRELRNVIERAVLLCGATIDLEHLPLEITLSADSRAEDESAPSAGTATGGLTAPGATLKDAREHDHATTERRLLLEALARFRGNKRAAARHLEIDPKTLYRLLKKHGIFAAAED